MSPSISSGCSALIREATTAPALSHPDIVTLYEIGHWDATLRQAATFHLTCRRLRVLFAWLLCFLRFDSNERTVASPDWSIALGDMAEQLAYTLSPVELHCHGRTNFESSTRTFGLISRYWQASPINVRNCNHKRKLHGIAVGIILVKVKHHPHNIAGTLLSR